MYFMSIYVFINTYNPLLTNHIIYCLISSLAISSSVNTMTRLPAHHIILEGMQRHLIIL